MIAADVKLTQEDGKWVITLTTDQRVERWECETEIEARFRLRRAQEVCRKMESERPDAIKVCPGGRRQAWPT